MSLLNGYQQYVVRDQLAVSILVLVDVALELRVEDYILYLHEEFQSLFSWMSLLNQELVASIIPEIGFQSLFSWMSLLNNSDEGDVDSDEEFQSLFSWMSLLNKTWRR